MKTRDELLADVARLMCYACQCDGPCRGRAIIDALLKWERERCALAVDELATRARSQKRSAGTKPERESGAVAEYALTMAATSVRGLT